MRSHLRNRIIVAIFIIFFSTGFSNSTFALPGTSSSKLKQWIKPCAITLSLLTIYGFAVYDNTQLKYRMNAEPRMGWENLSELKGSLPKYTEKKILDGEKYPSIPIPLTFLPQEHGRADFKVLTRDENDQIVNSQIDLAMRLLSISKSHPKIFVEGLVQNLNQESRHRMEMVMRGELKIQDLKIPFGIFDEYRLVTKYFPNGITHKELSDLKGTIGDGASALFFVGAAKILFYTGQLEELYGAESLTVQGEITDHLKKLGQNEPTDALLQYDSEFRGLVFWKRETAALKSVWKDYEQDPHSNRPRYLIFGDGHDFTFYSGRLFSISTSPH
ncbi:MAG: hypothetical protein JWQ35_518 [Bacteriovoracaceae bacterium]|nr:hypothetical protein [Bacteriovoracaceae bacterium]